MKLDRNSRLVRFAYCLRRPRALGYNTDKGFVSMAQYHSMTYADYVNYRLLNVVYSGVPERTSLCRFFWRAFVLMPLAIIPVGVVIGLTTLGGIVANAVVDSADAVVPKAIQKLQATGIDDAMDRVADKLQAGVLWTIRAVTDNIFIRWAKAAKQQACPIITFTGEQD